MNTFFSASNMGFYIEGLNSEVPHDAIAVSAEIHAEYASVAWPEHKVLGVNESGMPMWSDASPLTREELVRVAETRKQLLIGQANSYINSRQWPGKAAIGRLKSDELSRYNAWLDYLDALEHIDVLFTSDILWPQQPAI